MPQQAHQQPEDHEKGLSLVGVLRDDDRDDGANGQMIQVYCILRPKAYSYGHFGLSHPE